MTNILELSQNFCYNNNREVNARMSGRTKRAMATELQLPQHYVELDEQEMTYVDGGVSFGAGGISFNANEVFCATGGFLTWAASGYIIPFLSAIAGAVWGAIGWIPFVGQAVAGVLTAYIFANLSTLTWGFYRWSIAK